MKAWIVLALCLATAGCRIVHQGDSHIKLDDIEKVSIPAGGTLAVTINVSTNAARANSAQTKETPFDIFRGTTAAVMPGAAATGGWQQTGGAATGGNPSTNTSTGASATPPQNQGATVWKCSKCGAEVCPDCGDKFCPSCGQSTATAVSSLKAPAR